MTSRRGEGVAAMPHDDPVSEQPSPALPPRMTGRRIASRLGLDALWAAIMFGVPFACVGGGIVLGDSLDRSVASPAGTGGVPVAPFIGAVAPSTPGRPTSESPRLTADVNHPPTRR